MIDISIHFGSWSLFKNFIKRSPLEGPGPGRICARVFYLPYGYKLVENNKGDFLLAAGSDSFSMSHSPRLFTDSPVPGPVIGYIAVEMSFTADLQPPCHGAVAPP